MDNWYLKDARGGVVGPLSREVAADLVRSRPGLFVHGSRDGTTWQPLKVTPTLAEGEAPEAKLQRELSAAQQVELELDRYRELKPHHLFGVPYGSTDVKAWRQGFLNVAKRFHPGRLPKDVAPTLLRAQMAMYQYLTEVMSGVERRLDAAAAAAAAAPAPQPYTSSPSRSGAPVVWTLEHLGAKQMQNAVAAALTVTPSTAFVFSSHRLMNLNNHGVFFPVLPPLALGTRMDLTFHFEEAGRQVKAQGSVAMENSTVTLSQQLVGFGVRLNGVGPEERGFMLRESRRLADLGPRQPHH